MKCATCCRVQTSRVQGLSLPDSLPSELLQSWSIYVVILTHEGHHKHTHTKRTTLIGIFGYVSGIKKLVSQWIPTLYICTHSSLGISSQFPTLIMKSFPKQQSLLIAALLHDSNITLTEIKQTKCSLWWISCLKRDLFLFHFIGKTFATLNNDNNNKKNRQTNKPNIKTVWRNTFTFFPLFVVD